MHAPRVILALLVTMLLAPAAAHAADWYAAPTPTGSNANTCSLGHPCATISHVVDLAGVHDGDVVHLAAGTYDESVLTSKRLTYAGAGAGTPTSAAGASVIHAPGPYEAMALNGGGVLQDLRLRGHDGTAGSATGGAELGSRSGVAVSYTVTRVAAIGGHNTDTMTSPLNVWIDAQNAGSTVSANLQDLYASAAFTNGIAVQLQDATGGHVTSTTMTRTTLVPGPDGRALEIDGQVPVTLTDSSVQAATGALGITAQGALSLVRSRVDGGDEGIVWDGGGPLSILDSLVTAAPGTGSREALDLDAITAGAQSALIRGSTLVTRSALASNHALTLTTQAGSTVAVQFVDSIARMLKPDGTSSGGNELQTFLNTPGGVINFTASHSSFSSASAAPGTTLPAPGSGTNLAGDPGFVSFTGGNYALLPTSPLIDRGDPAAVAVGELDLAHQPRSLDGNADCLAGPDIGAYELTGTPASRPSRS